MHPCHVIILLFVVQFVPGVRSVKCYNCTRCKEPFVTSEHNAVECGDGQYCTKIVASLKWGHFFDSKKADRSCARQDMEPGCYEKEKSGLKSETCYCSSDHCNHGERHFPHTLTIVAVVTGVALGSVTC